MPRLTKKAFAAWLNTFGPRQVVGVRGSPKGCPLGRFLRSTGNDRAETRMTDYTTNGVIYRSLPPFAQKFMYVADSYECHRITASRARKILEGL